ncbi:MAG: hypothetical protein C5B60_06870 [Chloroflexi bacterium]|nr:MAG: hypothetical protein C5B60_06870 [Chloroflexota bacterium]
MTNGERERVTLIVGGGEFKDWTSIWVQDTWGDAFSQFKFTCAEREGAEAGAWQPLTSERFQPGEKCTILLAGELAITGIILKRQVAYDANDHGVVLQGANIAWEAETSCIVHKDSNFDDRSFLQIATEVLSLTDATVDIQGNISTKPLKRVQVQPGEEVFSFLQRLSRVSKVLVTSNEEGDVLLVGEGGGNGSQGQLEEGKNILKMQCVASIEMDRSEFMTRGQFNGDNKLKWRPASEQEAIKPGRYKGKRPKITPIEQGVDDEEQLKCHCENEAMWADLDHLQATITVQGWQPGGPGEGGEEGGDLWKAGSTVKVKSPMAGLDHELAIQSVTYTQDNQRGSLTTLLCVLPGALNSGPSSGFRRDSPTPTGPAKIHKGPARTGSK